MEQARDTQDDIFALLSDPATHGGHAVKRIDTHAASVFLAGERAFKVKRAVRLPFLDFSALAQRKAACEAEIEVNRPFAPEIYRRAVAITREADGRLVIGGAGEPVEWAVEMHRFDETQTLDHLAQQGRIDADMADRLGRMVAAAHARAAPVAPLPWIDAIDEMLAEHEAELGKTPDLFPPAAVATLTQAGRALYARIRPLLIERGDRGLIRRIHGDLHLGNIVLVAGRPVLFDAIEFSPLIGSGDLIYDLAFLLMDLDERALPQASNIVFNRYFAQTQRMEDLDALEAMPLYLSLRAAIRAKVTAERRERATPTEKSAIGDSARRYFDLALRAIAPAEPVMIATGGLSGTGKSGLAFALAGELAPRPGALVLRSDAERKALFGKDESERLPPQAYTAEVTRRVYALIADKARRAAAAGHSAILDAVFGDAGERALAETSAGVLGVTFRGLFLEAPLGSRLARVGGRTHDASDADAAIVRAQESYDLGKLEWIRIDASGSPADTLRRARAAL
ncbi:MAG TPA: AAA family ATPase [Xanthobacteraceae bacterium]|nr:AAA family ATPase [Xanthobacteraceae bacterium]